MENFFNTKNKLQKITQRNSQTERDSLRQKTDNNNLNKKINKSMSYQSKHISDLSIDWEDLDIGINIGEQYKTWEIIFEQFDIRLLPYLDIKILYRFETGTMEDITYIGYESLNGFLVPKIQKVFQIEDITGESSPYYKQVTCKISLYFRNISIVNQYQAKVNIVFINPRNY